MVTYGFYALFSVVGLANLYAGRWGVTLFYALCILGMVLFERKQKRASAKFDADMAASAAEHQRLMAQFDATTERIRKNTEELKQQIVAERRRYMAENYIVSIVIPRADFLPLTPDREASLRAEFDEAASQCLHNLRG